MHFYDTEEKVTMVIKASPYVIAILFYCSYQMHVILQNPSRYKTGSKDQIIDPSPPPPLPLLINNDIIRMCAGYGQCP